MKHLFGLLAFGAALASTTLPAMADMARNLGPMAGVVTLGEDGNWTAEDSDGWFVLTNTKQAGAIQYYWLEVPESLGRAYTVRVNLVAQNARPDPAYAGVLFNFRAGDRYFAVTIGSDGGGYFFLRQPEGFQTQRSPKIEARNDGSDVMTAQVTATKVQFDVNGTKFLEMENPDGFSPKLGIIAIGEGQFGFTGFSIEPAS